MVFSCIASRGPWSRGIDSAFCLKVDQYHLHLLCKVGISSMLRQDKLAKS